MGVVSRRPIEAFVLRQVHIWSGWPHFSRETEVGCSLRWEWYTPLRTIQRAKTMQNKCAHESVKLWAIIIYIYGIYMHMYVFIVKLSLEISIVRIQQHSIFNSRIDVLEKVSKFFETQNLSTVCRYVYDIYPLKYGHEFVCLILVTA